VRVLILVLLAIPAPAAPPISDPATYVAEVYGHYLKAQQSHRDYVPPEDMFTARLSKLIRDDRRRAKGEVGCLDFDFWINGQDWTVKNLKVTSGASTKDSWTVVAKFMNLGSPNEIHFFFRRIEGRWLLDEVRSLADPRWTLSEILKCTP
jgi:hypothetical protein